MTRGFTDQRAVSGGIAGKLGKRNAPTTLNVAVLQIVLLGRRSPTLDHQARQPILNPVEMGMPDEATALEGHRDACPSIQEAFQKAYGRQINYEDMRPGHRGLRADADLRRFALPAVRRRRR